MSSDPRPDLAEVLQRRALLDDANRHEATERRHAAGRRTARENLIDLLDETDTFVEYGGLAIAAQRRRRDVEDLQQRTQADGLIAGIGQVNGKRCAVMSYDYAVLAGTQGMTGHRKKDRLFELIEELELPVVFYAEGGGGRPGETDFDACSWLEARAFHLWARLSGRVPRVTVASGRCFAGNAAIAGCADLIVGTKDLNLGMGGPAMIAGGGLGAVDPDAIGPAEVQAKNGVLDLLVEDDAEATAAAKQLIGYFQGDIEPGTAPDQTVLRDLVPDRRTRAYDVRPAIETLADEGTAIILRDSFAPGTTTALVRIEGRAVGIVANNPKYRAGAIFSDDADKAARFMQLCDAFGLPIVSLVDTPGMMVGPAVEETALVRHCSRLFVTGAALRVPMVAVILRKCYGLGAQAMMGGSTLDSVLTVGWPTAELGPMGLEGAVRLGMRKELEAIEDPDEREAKVREWTEEAQEHAKGLNAASFYEIDDVIDPADTRRTIAATLASATQRELPPRHAFVDTW